MISILFVSLGLVSLQPLTAAECENATGQMEMTACARQRFERADAELNRLYREQIVAARESDRSPDNGSGASDGRPGEEATLRDAQRAWVTFRDAHCRGEGYAERGGSMEPMLYEDCRARLSRERIAHLTPQPSPE